MYSGVVAPRKHLLLSAAERKEFERDHAGAELIAARSLDFANDENRCIGFHHDRDRQICDVLFKSGIDGLANLFDRPAIDGDIAKQRIADRAVSADGEGPAQSRIAINGDAQHIATRNLVILSLRACRHNRSHEEQDKGADLLKKGTPSEVLVVTVFSLNMCHCIQPHNPTIEGMSVGISIRFRASAAEPA